MKRILVTATSAGFLVFGVGLYWAHGEEVPSLPDGPNKAFSIPSQSNSASNGGGVPQHYTVPRISSTDAPLRRRESKSCYEYLSICERSCKERGTMFKFQCIGQDFQPFQDHFRCQCADDMYYQQQAIRREQKQADFLQIHEDKSVEGEQ